VADDPEFDTDVFAIARGDQYYDKWWAVIDADEPETTHPAYPAEGKQKGASIWRCKECHGWDYKGASGAYASGSHFSGIKGIGGMANGNLQAIAESLRGEPHNYTKDMMPDKAIQRLALFVSAGQIDMDDYIDKVSKKAKGSPTRGARFYQTVCANCHGFDGKLLNFHDDDDPEYIGTVAQANPWETLHKIRMGQPGQPMPALTALEIQDMVDIVAFSQTLPAK
jgi:thiosulfate dehydrogenase